MAIERISRGRACTVQWVELALSGLKVRHSASRDLCSGRCVSSLRSPLLRCRCSGSGRRPAEMRRLSTRNPLPPLPPPPLPPPLLPPSRAPHLQRCMMMGQTAFSGERGHPILCPDPTSLLLLLLLLLLAGKLTRCWLGWCWCVG